MLKNVVTKCHQMHTQMLKLHPNTHTHKECSTSTLGGFTSNSFQMTSKKNVGCNKLFQNKNYNSFQSNIACLIFLKIDLNKYRVMYIG